MLFQVPLSFISSSKFSSYSTPHEREVTADLLANQLHSDGRPPLTRQTALEVFVRMHRACVCLRHLFKASAAWASRHGAAAVAASAADDPLAQPYLVRGSDFIPSPAGEYVSRRVYPPVVASSFLPMLEMLAAPVSAADEAAFEAACMG